MPEQLSQSQIDALLRKMSAGEVNVQEETRKIREYDFRSPKKFTKEQLKAVDSLHETFGRLLVSYFSGLLRTVCSIEVVQIEEQRYYEYSNALPDSALVGMLQMKPQSKRYDEATITMDLSTSVGFYFIDKVLGGPGTGYNYSRDYTDIEIAILSNIFEKVVQRFQSAWSSNLAVEAVPRGIETNARLLQVYAPEDIVVIVIMSVKMEDKVDGTLSICIPAEFLEEVIDVFSLRFAHAAKRPDPQEEEMKRRLLLENVCESEIEVKAVFDQFRLELRDIMQLQPDDVIPLNKAIDSDVLVTVDKIPWFTAKLGETKQKKAIKLNNLLSNGDEVAQWETSEASS